MLADRQAASGYGCARAQPLSGLVEIDETTTRHRIKEDPTAEGQGHSRDGKLLIAGAVEIKGQGPLWDHRG